MFKTIEWTDDGVVMLDQRRLPGEEIYRTLRSAEEVASAIRDMVIRGAPAIGVATAMGIALGFCRDSSGDPPEERFEQLGRLFASTRPTAVNLFWAIDRMRRCFKRQREADPNRVVEALRDEALAIQRSDVENNRKLGAFGAELLPDRVRALTHCNAGALATAGYGTALGVFRAAVEAGKKVAVYADETRPFLQGSRLTAWELQKDGIPVTVLGDGMAGHLFQKGSIDLCVVGADRIACNGDVANKIGTYQVAVLAKEHGVPFYVAAPTSTVDLETASGDSIPIEERDPHEMSHFAGRRIVPEGVPVLHPAFDVTPHRLIAAIITEAGIARPPYDRSLPALCGAAASTARAGR